MAKSYLLKDCTGGTIGYVQATPECIRCSVPEDFAMKGTMLWLFTEDGNHICHTLSGSGSEQVWKSEGVGIQGACVTHGGKRMADTGAFARRWLSACLLREEGKQDGGWEQTQVCAEQPECVKQTDVLQPESVMPQRRWPPHPCWSRAQYVDGVWLEVQNG